MFNFFGDQRREWRLIYTFVREGVVFSEADRFLTRQEAESRFQRMLAYHARLGQSISSARINGPRGYEKELIEGQV